MIGAIEVEGRIGCLWNGEGREGNECSVEVAFADFETDFWPVFHVVVFSLEETVEEFELSVYCLDASTSCLTFNENLPLYIPAAKRSKNLGPARRQAVTQL